MYSDTEPSPEQLGQRPEPSVEQSCPSLEKREDEPKSKSSVADDLEE